MIPYSQFEYIIIEEQLSEFEHNPSMPLSLGNLIRSRPYIQQSEQDIMLDDLCNIDLTYYVWGEKQSDEVGLCRGKDCNYCGRFNKEFRQGKDGEQK